MWKLEIEDLGRQDGFDLEAFLTDDPEWCPGDQREQYGVVVQASHKGIILGVASIWGIELDEDGDTMFRVLGTYGTDLVEEALQDARCSIGGLYADEEEE